jgi:signal transduction histidine kinase
LIVASYASGAYTNRRDGRVAALLIFVMLAAIAAAADEDRLGDGIFVGGLLLAVWGAGTVVRGRQELAAALQARTLELEHEREENARLAVAAERARIARELHDIVAHDLSIMVVQAGAERRALAGSRPETADVLATIEATGRTAMAEMRRLLGVLRRSADDVALAPQPTLRHLDDLVSQVREAGLPVELHVEGRARPLAPGVDLSAYRIVQEALTNALKHAGPARASVVLRYGDEALDVEVVDDGTGATAASAGGHGLIGMRERVAILGGSLDVGRRPGGGYAVRAKLPLAGGRA